MALNVGLSPCSHLPESAGVDRHPDDIQPSAPHQTRGKRLMVVLGQSPGPTHREVCGRVHGVNAHVFIRL